MEKTLEAIAIRFYRLMLKITWIGCEVERTRKLILTIRQLRFMERIKRKEVLENLLLMGHTVGK